MSRSGEEERRGGEEGREGKKIRRRGRERKEGNDRGTILNGMYISMFSTEPMSVFTLPDCIVAYSVVLFC